MLRAAVKTPLVYLDSSDFSRLSDPRKSPELARVEGALLQLKQAGGAAFPFSYAHVLEAAPTEAKFIDSAVARLTTIKRFCGPLALRDPMSLWTDELSGSHKSRVAITNKQGVWFPDTMGRFELLDGPIDLIKERARELPRSERRKLESATFRNGRVRTDAKAMLSSLAWDAVNRMHEQLPLTDRAKQLLHQYFSGASDDRTLIRVAMDDSLADLQCFADWYRHGWALVSPLHRNFRSFGEKLAAILGEAARKSRELVANLSDSHVAKELFTDRIRRELPQLLSNLETRMFHGIATSAGVGRSAGVLPTFAATPSLLTTIRVCLVAARMSGMEPGSTRNAKASDGGDFIHATYLPHVDIFRADGFTANALGACNLPWRTRVVARLEDLPQAIEEWREQTRTG